MTTAVVAVGGNALIRGQQAGTPREQRNNAAHVARCVAHLLEAGWDVVLTHGNGPHIGHALRRSELSSQELPPLPLDCLNAQTQGSIGYLLQQAIDQALAGSARRRPLATLVSRVRVDPEDVAFQNPTKPVGAFLDAAEAADVQAAGWAVVATGAGRWRRVVPSPTPLEILELAAIESCLRSGVLPIALGGGGIPVAQRPGRLEGLPGVIDKDRSAALLAVSLEAELLLICTNVDRVYVGFGTPDATPLDRVSTAALRAHLAAGEFPAGSMAPKIEAALDYVENVSAGQAIITDLKHASDAPLGEMGTRIVP